VSPDPPTMRRHPPVPDQRARAIRSGRFKPSYPVPGTGELNGRRAPVARPGAHSRSSTAAAGAGMTTEKITDQVQFAYWVPNVSGGLVTSAVEQRTSWDFDYNKKLAQTAERSG